MKLSLYFLFYVAMILELLIFIVDRDLAEEALRESYSRFAQSQSRLHISGPSDVTVYKGDSISLPFVVTGFWNGGERTALRSIINRQEYPIGTVEMSSASQTLRLMVDTVYGGFKLLIKGLKEDSSQVAISAVLHRGLSGFPDDVRLAVLERTPAADRLGSDSLIVQCDTVKLRVKVIGRHVKDEVSGTQWR